MKKLKKILSLSLLVILAGCNFFAPRSPQEPEDQSPEWNYFPTSPLLTLQNLEYAWEYRQNNNRYSEIFNEDYNFYYDNQDVNDLHLDNIFLDKNKEEKIYLNCYNFVPADSSVSVELTLDSSQDDVLHTDEAWFYRFYEIKVGHSRPELAHSFKGRMILYLIKENSGFWKIKEWHDQRATDALSWGRMKYEFLP